MTATFTCWGEVLWDMFPSGPQLGGAVGNVAFHLATLGEPVQLVSRVGDDELGREALRILSARGVDTRLIQIDPSRSTGQVNVTLARGEPRYSLSTGGAWEHIELSPEAAEALQTSDFLCIGTLAQRNEQGRESLSRALEVTPPSCSVVIDANVRPVHLDHGWLGDTLARAAVVKMNEREAELIREQFCEGREATECLHDVFAVDFVALTLGASGCELSDKSGRKRHSGFAASPGGDNVGAGDAFVAVMLLGLSRGWPLAIIAERANRYAAHVASHPGATPDAPSELVKDVISDT